MSKKQTNILAATAAHFPRALKLAPEPVAERVQQAQSDVADKRKRAQVNEEVLRLRLR